MQLLQCGMLGESVYASIDTGGNRFLLFTRMYATGGSWPALLDPQHATLLEATAGSTEGWRLLWGLMRVVQLLVVRVAASNAGSLNGTVGAPAAAAQPPTTVCPDDW